MPFRSIDAWFTHSEFVKLVKEEWGRLRRRPITEKLKNLKIPIRTWNKERFGHIDVNIDKLESKISILEVKRIMILLMKRMG